MTYQGPLLTSDQVNDILQNFITEKNDENDLPEEQKTVQLKALTIHETDLSQIDPTLFARACVKLFGVGFRANLLSTDQITYLCQAIVNNGDEMDEEELETLWVFGNDLSQVCPSLLARAIVKMRCAQIGYTVLTPEQATTLFLFETIVEQEDMMLDYISIGLYF